MFEELMTEGKVRLPVANPTESVTHLEVDVEVSPLDGLDLFRRARIRRGIYVWVTPVLVKGEWVEGAGHVDYRLSRWRQNFRLALPRASLKCVEERLQAERCLVRYQLEQRAGSVWELVEQVCREEKIELAPRDAEEAMRREAVLSETAALVYADWLEERGRYDEAAKWREVKGVM